MQILIYLISALVLTEQVTVPTSREASLDEIRLRLAAYENREPQLPADPAVLARIARIAMGNAARSRDFAVWAGECASRFTADSVGCSARLWGMLQDNAAPITSRASAGAALLQRGDVEAAPPLFNILKDLSAKDLTPLVHVIRLLPNQRAAPLLLRMLSSPAAADKVAACRVIGMVDSGEVRRALATTVAEASPGLEVWNACMIARARLREPDSVNTISGYSHYLTGDALLDAADAMLGLGNDQAIFLLKKITREARPAAQLAAAERLADSDGEYASKVVDGKLRDADPELRARALVVERRLNRPPSAVVRAMLVDPDELVQLRAAEAILEWARRIDGR